MDLFSLAARLTLDKGEYEQSLWEAAYSATDFASRLTEALVRADQQTQTSAGSVAASAAAAADEVAQAGARVSRQLTSLAGQSGAWGRDMMDGFIGGIRQRWETLRNAISGVAGMVRRYLGFSEPEEGPLSNFHTYAPDMMALFAKGIRDNAHLVTDQIGSSFALAPAMASAMPADLGVGEEIVVPRGGGAPRAVNVVLQLDRATLGQAIVALNDEENQRVGMTIAKGGN